LFIRPTIRCSRIFWVFPAVATGRAAAVTALAPVAAPTAAAAAVAAAATTEVDVGCSECDSALRNCSMSSNMSALE